MSTEEEEEDEFLLVDDDRMEDVVILSEPSSGTDEQELMPSLDYSPAVIGTLELSTSDDKSRDDKSRDTQCEGEATVVDIVVEETVLRAMREDSVEMACQTEDMKSYPETITENIRQGTYASGKCFIDGCSSFLKSFKIGTAPGNFTGTLKEDITQISTHISGIIMDFSKELSLERIKYKLFM